jgi:hypothetical protein
MTCIICESTIPDLHLVEIENHYVEVCDDCTYYERRICACCGGTGQVAPRIVGAASAETCYCCGGCGYQTVLISEADK